MSLIEDLKWRHACKGMNGAKVPQDVVERILEAINLTPTSLGMQAFKVFVIENKELKDKIYNEACEQQPITGFQQNFSIIHRSKESFHLLGSIFVFT